LKKHNDIFRVACLDDVDAILGFTANGVQGLTNVPRTRERVEEQLQETVDTISGKEGANRLIFVVERDGKVLGISGIIVRVGIEAPFYNFKRNHHSGRATNPVLAVDYDTLQITTDFNGYTEVASLFMGPEGRGTGLARLLSMGRFGYIRNNRDQFADGVMAEILGWTDENGNSPFWQHLTSRFIHMDFDNADKLSTVDKRFIVDLLPGIPIMLNLLPDIVTKCTGKPHASSARAMKMLQFRASLGPALIHEKRADAHAAQSVPSIDTTDGQLHLTAANLVAMPHRSIEAPQTERLLKAILPKAVVHSALPSNTVFGDEGAANHNRMSASHGTKGLEVFVYGREALRDCQQTKFPGRQTLEASQAVARLHKLDDDATLYLRQSAKAIDAGAFHNDVVCVTNGPVMFFHKDAFDDVSAMQDAVKAKADPLGFEPEFLMADIPIEDAIRSYLFNSQYTNGESLY